MRFLPFLLTILFGAGMAFGQQQEKKLMDRIDRPDTTKAFDLRQSSFSAKNDFQAGSARTKEFQFRQSFAPKEFRSRDFYGAKAAHVGNGTFSTRDANTRGKYTIPNATARVNSKVAAVKDARESDKTMETRPLAGGNRPYLGPEAERMQRRIDPANQPAGWTGDLRPMTIDDVRELLNKNK